ALFSPGGSRGQPWTTNACARRRSGSTLITTIQGGRLRSVEPESRTIRRLAPSLVSDKPGTLELRELSLAINSPDGALIIVGCSHPGIDKIVETASAINPRIHFVAIGVTQADLIHADCHEVDARVD